MNRPYIHDILIFVHVKISKQTFSKDEWKREKVFKDNLLYKLLILIFKPAQTLKIAIFTKRQDFFEFFFYEKNRYIHSTQVTVYFEKF